MLTLMDISYKISPIKTKKNTFIVKKTLLNPEYFQFGVREYTIQRLAPHWEVIISGRWYLCSTCSQSNSCPPLYALARPHSLKGVARHPLSSYCTPTCPPMMRKEGQSPGWFEILLKCIFQLFLSCSCITKNKCSTFVS